MTTWSALCVKAQLPWTTASKTVILDAAQKNKTDVASLPPNWWYKERKSWCTERDAKPKWPVKRKMICTARPVGLTTPAILSAVKEICVMLAHLLLSALSPSSHAPCCLFFTTRTILYGSTNGYVTAAGYSQAIVWKNNPTQHICIVVKKHVFTEEITERNVGLATEKKHHLMAGKRFLDAYFLRNFC